MGSEERADICVLFDADRVIINNISVQLRFLALNRYNLFCGFFFTWQQTAFFFLMLAFITDVLSEKMKTFSEKKDNVAIALRPSPGFSYCQGPAPYL